MMAYVLKASVIIAVFYCTYELILKRETFFNTKRWFLFIGLVVAIVFPSITITVYETITPTKPIDLNITNSLNANNTVITQATSTQAINWQNIIIAIYWLGVAVFASRFLLQITSLIVLLVKYPKNKVGRFTYVIVKHKVSPFSFFKWIVFNPKAYSKNELQLIINHEKTHASQWHSVDILFVELISVIFWFNPLIWFYHKAIKQNLEFIADFKAQQSTPNKKHYQALLLKTSVPNQHIVVASYFYNSLIKKRIVMLNKPRSSQKKQWQYLLVIPVLIGLLMSMNTKTVFIEPVTKATSPKSNFDEVKATKTNEIIELKFNKTTSDKTFETVKKLLKNKGVAMMFKKIKRNAKGYITDLQLNFKNATQNVDYTANNANGIKPFVFVMEGDTFSVQPLSSNNINSIPKIHKNSKVFILNSHDNNSKKIEIKTDGDKNEYIFINTEEEIIELKDNDTAKIKIFKTKPHVIINDDADVNVEVITNEDVNVVHLNDSIQNLKNFKKGENKPLIILNDKKIIINDMELLDANTIDAVNVLKGNAALNAYGDDGKNGVIIIKTKDNKNTASMVRLKSTTNHLYTITKSTTNTQLEAYKNNLKTKGILVKYTKLKRNKNGDIKSIKITLSNNNGSKSSGSFKDSNAISNVKFGLSNGSLIVTSP